MDKQYNFVYFKYEFTVIEVQNKTKVFCYKSNTRKTLIYALNLHKHKKYCFKFIV